MQSFLPILAPILGAFFVLYIMFEIKKSPAGEGKMVEIAEAIKEGAISYLKRQYRTIAVVSVALFVILYFIFGIKTGIGFLVGAALSALSGFVGMMISTQANVKVAEAAKKGMKQAFNLSFKGGLVTGLLVVSLGLLAVASFYFLTKDFGSLIALGFGASLISVFSRLGGGIYTKAADVGADIVGKVEKGIPEDDPRNPAVIADQVGDNVGDCAGMAADIFETYAVTAVATMLLGALLFPRNINFVLLPLILGSVSILTSIIGSFFVKLGKKQSIMGAMYKGVAATVILSAIAFYPVIVKLMANQAIPAVNLYFSTLVGLVIAVGMFVITEYYTSKSYAIASSGLAALFLFSAYSEQIKESFSLTNPSVITGLLIGGLLPYLFASFLMGAVGKTAGKVVEEVRRQFKNIKGLIEGTAKPEYGKCVDIVTKAAIKEMLLPALIPVAAPVLVGYFLGVQALGGLLIGAIVTGLF